MLIYVEYISRRSGVSLESFHKLAGGGQTGWAEANTDDTLVAMLGRTWRTGPEPEYLGIWWTPGAGLERIDDWERTFRSGDADAFEEPFAIAARIDRAGSYDPLLEPVVGTTERYYLEFFDLAPDATRDDVRAAYEERRARHPALTLNLVADRIGRLAPDPRGLALWGLESWASLDGIVRDLDEEGPVRLVTAGLYSQLGRETL